MIDRVDFDRLVIYALLFANIPYTIFVLWASYVYPLSCDDWGLLAGMDDGGLFAWIKSLYVGWSGRLSGFLIVGLELLSYKYSGNNFLSTFLIVILYLYTFYRLFSLLPGIKEVKNYRLLLLGFSLFFLNLFILSNLEPSSFLWMSGSYNVFTNPLIILGFIAIASPSGSIGNYLRIALIFLFVGCSVENYALWTLMALFPLSFFYYWKNRSIMSNFRFKKASLAFVCCLLMFLVMYMAPGNKIRLEQLKYFSRIGDPTLDMTDFNILPGIKTAIKSTFIFLFNTSKKLVYGFLLIFPFIYLGSLTRKKEETSFLTYLIVVASVAIIPLLIILFLPSSIAASYAFLALRSLQPLVLIFLMLIAILAFFTGYFTLVHARVAACWAVLSMAFFLFLSAVVIKQDVRDTRLYVKSVQKRVGHLKELKKQDFKGIIYLDLLVYPSDRQLLLMKTEIESDSTRLDYYINKGMQRLMGLEYKIFLKR